MAGIGRPLDDVGRRDPDGKVVAHGAALAREELKVHDRPVRGRQRCQQCGRRAFHCRCRPHAALHIPRTSRVGRHPMFVCVSRVGASYVLTRRRGAVPFVCVCRVGTPGSRRGSRPFVMAGPGYLSYYYHLRVTHGEHPAAAASRSRTLGEKFTTTQFTDPHATPPHPTSPGGS